MAKSLKKAIVAEYVDWFKDVDGGVFIDYQGISAKDAFTLRAQLRKFGLRIKVVKNSLFEVAMAELGRFGRVSGDDRVQRKNASKRLHTSLEGPVAVIFTEEEGSAFRVAKTLKNERKKLPRVKVKGGFAEGEFVDEKTVSKVWTEVPSREELVAQVAGSIVNMGGSLLSAILAPAAQIASQIEKLGEEKESAPSEAPAASEAPVAAEAPAGAEA
ncbi:MAG: 50S ribosomal protein L10 [Planctomycetes bacterium]|nr:50S ribosomal protein L10 [Planctomycetota bacterium]